MPYICSQQTDKLHEMDQGKSMDTPSYSKFQGATFTYLTNDINFSEINYIDLYAL